MNYLNFKLDKPILIMGLPGSGKSTLARALANKLSLVHWNADEVRGSLNKDLGFSIADRIEQATRMRFLCDTVLRSGQGVIADFVCPTRATQEAFGPAYVIYVDRLSEGRYEDTNRIFTPPLVSHVHIRYGLSVEEELHQVLASLVVDGYLHASEPM